MTAVGIADAAEIDETVGIEEVKIADGGIVIALGDINKGRHRNVANTRLPAISRVSDAQAPPMLGEAVPRCEGDDGVHPAGVPGREYQRRGSAERLPGGDYLACGNAVRNESVHRSRDFLGSAHPIVAATTTPNLRTKAEENELQPIELRTDEQLHEVWDVERAVLPQTLARRPVTEDHEERVLGMRDVRRQIADEIRVAGSGLGEECALRTARFLTVCDGGVEGHHRAHRQGDDEAAPYRHGVGPTAAAASFT